MGTVNIGVIDDKFQADHDDLHFAEPPLGNISNDDSFWDIFFKKEKSHGTHVAGIIAAGFDNKEGITGIMPFPMLYGVSAHGIFRYNILKENKREIFGISLELVYLIDMKKTKVVNISLGYNSLIEFAAACGNDRALEYLEEINEYYSLILSSLIDNKNEFLICKGAGNQGNFDTLTSGYRYVQISEEEYKSIPEEKRKEMGAYVGYMEYSGKKPKEDDAVSGVRGVIYFSGITDKKVRDRIIVVGAIENDNGRLTITDFSQVGNGVDILAPGDNIYSTVYTNDYDFMDGTSVAAPHVSGVAAMIFGIDPTLSGAEVKDIILKTATGQYWHDLYNYHQLVDAEAAVKEAIVRKYGKIPQKGSVLGKIYNEIGGVVTDSVTLDFYKGTDISGSPIETITTSMGYYEVSLYEGEYTVIISGEGYMPATFNIVSVGDITKENQDFTIFFKLGGDSKFEGGDGKKDNPYQIKTPTQLNAIQDDLTACYILMNDIDLSEFNKGEWIPIGDNYLNMFEGTLDGNGHKICNLKITSSELQYVGLFGCVGGNAIIENLRLVNTFIDVNYTNLGNLSSTGSLAGIITGSATISNCSNTGNIVSSAPEPTVGGLVGVCGVWNSDKVLIKDCFNTANVSSITNKNGGDTVAGGIAGTSVYGCELINCYNLGNVNSLVNATYGLSYSAGISNGGGTISNCVVLSIDIQTIANGTTKSVLIGGLTRTNNLASQETTGNAFNDASSLITSASAKSKSTYENLGWDFLNVWQMVDGQDYPQLR